MCDEFRIPKGLFKYYVTGNGGRGSVCFRYRALHRGKGEIVIVLRNVGEELNLVLHFTAGGTIATM